MYRMSDATRVAVLQRLWPRMTKLRHHLQSGMQGGLSSLAGLNLTVPQAMALFRLAEQGPQTVSALQQATGRSQAATSHLLGTLEKKGLVSRGTDDSDARRTRVRITSRALALIEQVEGLRARGFEKTFAPVPTAVARRLDEALAAVLEALGGAS